ncbi:N-formylglutamate amidohydrolase [Roseobacter weihaiensis]|uniref:N-formylglutamate amidohydrolase n=1 Tax=Roseobacter weihaiensis TaxID=2763262 RepID=UPI001D0A7783|nr:N-formylglutamate amidohydrolase [Roseobacter sp. H9]
MPVDVILGDSPLVLSLPYKGTNMQNVLVQRLIDRHHFINVPDRYLDRLLEGLTDEATVVQANFHRYVSDVEHPSQGPAEKAENGMIGVVPLLDLEGAAIWDRPPTRAEAARWRSIYYAPYHAALATQIARARALYGHAVLVTCHALPSDMVRRNTAGLQDINLATFLGASCSLDLSTKLVALCQTHQAFGTKVDSGIKTGWATRRYGRPRAKVHALDLRLNEACYLSADGEADHYDETQAEPFREMLRDVMGLLASWRPLRSSGRSP